MRLIKRRKLALRRKNELKRLRREMTEQVLKFALLHQPVYASLVARVKDPYTVIPFSYRQQTYKFFHPDDTQAFMSESKFRRVMNAIAAIQEAQDDPGPEGD